MTADGSSADHLHHVPSFGQSEPNRAADLKRCEETYLRLFGEKYTFVGVGTCPAGRDCQGEGCCDYPPGRCRRAEQFEREPWVPEAWAQRG